MITKGKIFSPNYTVYTVYSLGSIYSGNSPEWNIISTSSNTVVEEKGVIISSEIRIFLLYPAILFP